MYDMIKGKDYFILHRIPEHSKVSNDFIKKCLLECPLGNVKYGKADEDKWSWNDFFMIIGDLFGYASLPSKFRYNFLPIQDSFYHQDNCLVMTIIG